MKTFINTDTLCNYLLELTRPHLETLAKEIDAGRTRRLICVEEILAETPNEFASSEVNPAAYEVRYGVEGYLGTALADEDEEEDSFGIPAIESFLVLSQLYGPDWVRLGYAHSLRNSEVPCKDPYAVASAVMAKAKAEAAYAVTLEEAA